MKRANRFENTLVKHIDYFLEANNICEIGKQAKTVTQSPFLLPSVILKNILSLEIFMNKLSDNLDFFDKGIEINNYYIQIEIEKIRDELFVWITTATI